jgi:hypothetical protein
MGHSTTSTGAWRLSCAGPSLDRPQHHERTTTAQGSLLRVAAGENQAGDPPRHSHEAASKRPESAAASNREPRPVSMALSRAHLALRKQQQLVT